VRFDRISVKSCVALSAALLMLQGAALLAFGRPVICECGHVSLWYGNPSGPETSQQFTDWYTWTHLLHGFLLYLLLGWIAPNMPVRLKVACAFGVEAAWEIAENTPFVVERYRQSAHALGYSGDSLVNSFGDSLAMGLGFALARVLPVRLSIATVVGVELFLAAMIHDNLTLNIFHLIRPDAAPVP
jgi:hypothetical protein